MANKKKAPAERLYYCKHLVVDSAPLLEAPLSSLRGCARTMWLTHDVVNEMRDSRHRNILEEAKLHLPADTLLPGQEIDEMTRTKEGFEVREPTAEAVAKITAFARKTGDIAVLSTADIRVLALCLTLELEENGSWRVRDHPGQVLTGPPKEEEKKDEVEGKGKEVEKNEDEGEKLAEGVEQLSVVEESTKGEEIPIVEEETSAASTSTLPPPVPTDFSTDSPAPSASTSTPSTDAAPSTSSSAPRPSSSSAPSPADDADDVDSGDESDSSAGSWITPDNVLEHKVRDLGLFSAPDATSADSPIASTSAAAAGAPAPRPRTIMKAAVLTGDYAMQNVALQMGLNVLGSGGKRVKEVRTWVLRCHACFKLCKNPDKRFCPSCGGATLLRTSITYVPATPQNPQGYILHLKSNYNYRLRGTQYSLPTPKMGRAGGGPQAQIITREDQKEWVKGVRSAEVKREKEQRALQKALLDDEEKRKAGLLTGSSASASGWFAEAGSLEAQMLGIGGGKGGIENPKGRRRGGKNGAGGEVRLDKSGLPVIGMGRKNPNEARRRR